jgi:tRNA A-37 threonylcarbamoyl transferase component Bud32
MHNWDIIHGDLTTSNRLVKIKYKYLKQSFISKCY